MPQSRMAFFDGVEFWAAGPFGEVALQHVPDEAEVVRMHGADHRRLRQRVHAVVEAIDQGVDCGAAADPLEHGDGDVAVGHCWS